MQKLRTQELRDSNQSLGIIFCKSFTHLFTHFIYISPPFVHFTRVFTHYMYIYFTPFLCISPPFCAFYIYFTPFLCILHAFHAFLYFSHLRTLAPKCYRPNNYGSKNACLFHKEDIYRVIQNFASPSRDFIKSSCLTMIENMKEGSLNILEIPIISVKNLFLGKLNLQQL